VFRFELPAFSERATRRRRVRLSKLACAAGDRRGLHDVESRCHLEAFFGVALRGRLLQHSICRLHPLKRSIAKQQAISFCDKMMCCCLCSTNFARKRRLKSHCRFTYGCGAVPDVNLITKNCSPLAMRSLCFRELVKTTGVDDGVLLRTTGFPGVIIRTAHWCFIAGGMRGGRFLR